jgi:hypothetical protein
VAVVKPEVSPTANERPASPISTTIVRSSTASVRLAIATERPPSSTATASGRLSMAAAARRSSSSANAQCLSSSCDAVEPTTMWMMMKMKMRKTRKMRKMMIRIRVAYEGEAAGRVVAVAAARSARNRQHPWLRRSERSSPPFPAKPSPGGRRCSMSNLRRR